MSVVERFETLLAQGHDNALLRFTLGEAMLADNRVDAALEHLSRALEHDASYTAAWRAYAKALTAADRPEDALAAYQRGIEVAKARGDLQAGKEMEVFARRLARSVEAGR